jgi:hypothetical protein
MKPFTSYLQESHRIYEFKVKIADSKCSSKDISAALSQFQCKSCSSGKSLPIAESHADFPVLLFLILLQLIQQLVFKLEQQLAKCAIYP